VAARRQLAVDSGTGRGVSWDFDGMTRKPVSKKAKDITKPPHIISDNGDLFIVMHGDRRIALGLIARGGKKACKLGFFFRIDLYDNAENKSALTLEPEQAIWVHKFGDLHVLRGKWPVIGKLKGFSREAWPMPVFMHHHDGFNIDYIRAYNENDIAELSGNWRSDQVPSQIDTSFVVKDGLAGAGYVEDALMEILGLQDH
jgi:Immunity protein 26